MDAAIFTDELNLGKEALEALRVKELLDRGEISHDEAVKQNSAEIMDLVDGLQKIEHLDKRKTRSNVENFIKLLLTLSPYISVILVQIGLKLQALRNIAELSAEQQADLAEETSLLYVPLAHRIGLYRVKTEMEERIMAFRDRPTWDFIEQKLAETQKERERYTREFIRPIARVLKEQGFSCEIRSRVKSIPSIHRKMQAQKVDFEKVYDLFAIRIIINNILENEKSDCWKVYSLVTDIYTPNPKRLRDWISFPKTTGYESLHTTVIGPEGKWVEVQIRTRRMDDIAEQGIAAHWKYKSSQTQSPSSDLYARIREMLEKSAPKEARLTGVADKKALYSDEIFIFTPKGDLKRLKAGYTVLDFAFEVHTEVGSTCTGAIVNGKMVPLKYVLQNGDTVRIMTSKTQKPNSGWLEMVKSPRNLARIKHALKMDTYKASEQGKEIIKNKVIQLGHEFTDIIISKLVAAFECENYLDLYQKFGEGKLDPLKIKKALLEPEPEVPVTSRPEHAREPISKVITGKEEFLIIDNREESYHYQFAKCCNPVPGNNIFAFISVAKGIKIHRTDCPNAHQLVTRYPYRILEARWRG